MTTDNKFNLKDRVTIVKCEDAPAWVGQTGEVVEFVTDGRHPYWVRMANGELDFFSADEMIPAVTNSAGLSKIERRALSFAIGQAAGISRDKKFWDNLRKKVLG